MIIDERKNNGGQADNYITDILSHHYLGSWKDRDGMIFDTPGAAVYGPKVMLIDQDAGSGGDFLPYSFRRMGIGKLIGKTTWGGLIGIENEGVSPDMDVVLDPVLVNKGRDTQLEAGIKELLSQLKSFKPIKLDHAPPLPTKLGD